MPKYSKVYNGVSVILPVYNGYAYLKESVHSLLNQNILEFEILISDDGSNDGSNEILQEIEGCNRNNVHVFYQQRNLGLFSNLNFLISKSKYPLIHLWSQDDVMKPECLSEIIDFHNRFSDISMSYHSLDYIDEEGHLISDVKKDNTPPLISPIMYANICIRWGCLAGNISNVTLVRSSIDKIGFFNQNLKVSGDFELFTRLSNDNNIGFLNKRLIYLRRHKGQLSKSVSSTLNFMIEDIPIYKGLINRIKNYNSQMGERYWRWRIQVMYMNELFSLIRKGELWYAWKVFSVLKRESNITLLFFRWNIIRLLRVIKKDSWFYDFIERK